MKSLLRSTGAGTAAALVAVVITFFIADAVSGPLMANDPSGELAEVPFAGAIIGTVLGGVIGMAITFAVRKRGNPVTVFGVICVVGLIAYGAYAVSAAGTTSTAVWLNVMHLVAAIPIVGSLVNWLQHEGSAT